jgi:hypothetical protein
MSKKCVKCGVEKTVEHFYKDASQADGLNTACKACRNAYAKARYTPIPRKGRTIDITNQRFGRLTALQYHKYSGSASLWECICDCGRTSYVDQYALRKGTITSCGCWRNEKSRARAITHGKSKTRLYTNWSAMVRRCSSPSSKSFQWYGARGITVCDRWRESFENFLADMGPPPSESHTLDRIDNDGNYEPSNCRWATAGEQNRNSRRTRLVTINGKTQCLKDWANEVGIHYVSLMTRLKKGWSVEDAILTPAKQKRGGYTQGR